MDLTKLVWLVVILAIGGGVWLFTDGGMDNRYEAATKNLVGNDPDQDVIDEAILSKYGGTLMTTFRYEKAKKFYTASIDRYGPAGKSYWYNLEQLAKCEEKLGNDLVALDILYGLWVENGDAHDERVSSRSQLKPRIIKLIEFNGLLEGNYPMNAATPGR